MDDLPVQPGIYALFLSVTSPFVLSIGRLGQFEIPSGLFSYQGSAQGPGGINGRLGRHLLGNKLPHWHIDYLREKSDVEGCIYILHRRLDFRYPKLECTWSQALQGLPGASVPVPGFGASDCKSGCLAHLVHVSNNIAFDNRLRRKLLEILASGLMNQQDDQSGTNLTHVQIKS